MNKPVIYCILSALLAFALSTFFFRFNYVDNTTNYQDSLNIIVKNYDLQRLKSDSEKDSLLKVIDKKDQKLSQVKLRYSLVKDTALTLIKNAPKECDSLALFTSKLIKEGEVKDSAFEAKIQAQKELIANRDTAVVNCTKSFVLLEKVAQNTINLNLGLQSENSKLKKKVDNKNKLITGLGAAFVLVTSLLILK